MGKHDNDVSDACRACASIERRRLLRSAAGGLIGALTAFSAVAGASPDARKLPARAGDTLSFPSWENDGRLLVATDIVVGAPPLLAYPRDADTGVIRERSRLNQILLLRFLPAELDEAQRALSADGVLAYSGLCTHTACGVTEWDADKRHLLCPCHGSAFDPLQRGARVAGPAPRALPALPLALDGAHFVIAGAFTSAVGANA